jgi:hypothetical protein
MGSKVEGLKKWVQKLKGSKIGFIMRREIERPQKLRGQKGSFS